VIMIDPLNQPPDLLRLQVVDAQRNPAAGSYAAGSRLVPAAADRIRRLTVSGPDPGKPAFHGLKP
jgi:hypothetical protein